MQCLTTHLQQIISLFAWGSLKTGMFLPSNATLRPKPRLLHSRLQHFPFPSHSLPASSLPLGGFEPPHPCPLGCRRKLYTNSIRQVIAILALPRVRGTVKRRRGVFLRTISNWQKVTGAYVCIAVCPPIHPIYIAPLCSALAPRRGTTSCSPMLDQALLE